jgi:methyl-accepting chemotaxis protein
VLARSRSYIDLPVPPNSDRRLGAAVSIVGLIAAAGTVVAVVLGWRLIGSPIEQLDRLSTATSDALVKLTGNLTLVQDTIAQMQSGLTTTVELLGDSAESANQIEASLSDTAEALEGSIPDRVSSVQRALPELIASTSVLEPTLRSLSFLGVEYDPEVPLNRTLRQLRRSLRPLPGELRASGERLASLSGDTAMLASQLNELALTVDAIADDLAEAETLFSEQAEAAEATRELVDVERAQLPVLERRARVVLVIFGAAIGITQLALALVGWAHWRSEAA